MQVKQIINSVFSSNTYILSTHQSDDIWLIDIGDIDSVLDNISDSCKINSVFITHTHYDHIYGVKELIKLFPDCTIYTSDNGRKGFLSDQYNFSRYHNDSFIFDSPNISVLREGDTIKLTETEHIEVIETPGHDWSCLTFKIRDEILFTGDSFIPGLKVITTFPKSDKMDSEKSTTKIYSLISKRTMIYPGHGNIVTLNAL